MGHIQDRIDSPILYESVNNQTFRSGEVLSGTEKDPDKSSSVDSVEALQSVATGIMNSVSPVQFMDSINAGNSAIGNKAFLQFTKGLHHQRQSMSTRSIAAKGVQGHGQPMTHLEPIQQAFGHHDVSSMREYTGSAAQAALAGLGADGFSSNGRMAFCGSPDLYTQAHEAAHGVQQAALGDSLQLKGGIGEAGDKYERHADAVAEKVTRGESAEPLLDQMVGDPTTVSPISITANAPFQLGRNKRTHSDTSDTSVSLKKYKEDRSDSGFEQETGATLTHPVSAEELKALFIIGYRYSEYGRPTKLAAQSMALKPEDVLPFQEWEHVYHSTMTPMEDEFLYSPCPIHKVSGKYFADDKCLTIEIMAAKVSDERVMQYGTKQERGAGLFAMLVGAYQYLGKEIKKLEAYWDGKLSVYSDNYKTFESAVDFATYLVVNKIIQRPQQQRNVSITQALNEFQQLPNELPDLELSQNDLLNTQDTALTARENRKIQEVAAFRTFTGKMVKRFYAFDKVDVLDYNPINKVATIEFHK